MNHDEIMTMLGAKYYRQIDEDNFEILRVINIKGTDQCVCLINDEREELMPPGNILSHYTKLIPDGLMTFAIVSTKLKGKDLYTDDVIITVRTAETIMNDVDAPDALCRQNIMDIFHAMVTGKDDTDYVGLSICRSEIPANMPVRMLTECDRVDYIVTYNTYISDTPFTFLNFMKGKRLRRFDTVLENGLKEYLKSKNIPDAGQMSVKGHCRNLETLIANNNFSYDYDQVYGITPINDVMEDNLEDDTLSGEIEYKKLNSNLTNIFSNVFKMKISKTLVIKYDHRIDLSEFDNNTVFLVRDKKGILYVVRYVPEGEYLESELELQAVAAAMEHITTVNKYSKNIG